MPVARSSPQKPVDLEAAGVDGNMQLLVVAAAGILADLQRTGSPTLPHKSELGSELAADAPALQGRLQTPGQQESWPLAPQAQVRPPPLPSLSTTARL